MTTPAEFSAGIGVMVADARKRGGGRLNCCSRGRCALHLAEEHPAGGTASTIHLGHSLAFVPNFGDQELVGAFARAGYAEGLRVLGLDPEAFV